MGLETKSPPHHSKIPFFLISLHCFLFYFIIFRLSFSKDSQINVWIRNVHTVGA